MQIKYLILLLCLNNSAFVYAGNGTESEESEKFDFGLFCGQAEVWSDLPMGSYPPLPASPDEFTANADGELAQAASASSHPVIKVELEATSFASSAPSSHRSGKAKKKHPREDDPQEDAEKKARRQLKNQESAASSRERKKVYTEEMRLRVIQLEAQLEQAQARIAQLEAERQEERDSGCFSCRGSASY